MSLDVYLTIEDTKNQNGKEKIFIREDGQTKEITHAEWNKRFPEREPVTLTISSNDVYSANITHNLGKMASEAGIYEHLWRPDENDMEKAAQLISGLEAGLQRLKDRPKHFKTFNPSNGWGNYEGLVRFIENYLAACKKCPTADVYVSR